ncbi:zinc-dependent alcohol dehydrogenase family protein [Amycolatopsis rhabdoformis]|uniref:Zinc-dependent alcohol dehydrogenase family protein n=1 Tax=Amycolatopsis rhabdoformis TaxID=1448059 RepID=A0ABZ1IDH7_9PSEU|nr:zinc-dependent alcohol dehydrogenase family protein [Amycolatopsis rhabdoformis]WSE32520.1 zinc-dependent alcohol dehydrogenase family protein [Amycolatopsis rhabdoformis]
MTRTVRFHELGGPDVLRLEEVPEPRAKAGEVLIHARAWGLNRADSLFRQGQYGVAPALPSGLGFEVAGVVAAVGEGVTDFHAGQAVSVVPGFDLLSYPMHGESVVAPANFVVAHPKELSFEQAASTWMQYITAYGGLVDLANTRPGDTVVISAASSSVGLAAIQIARREGAKTIALTRTSAKRQRLLDAGADAVVATTEEDVVARILELTDGRGARVLFDPVGGAALAGLISAAATGAFLVVYGVLDFTPATVSVLDLLLKRLTIRGFGVMELALDDPGRLAAAVDHVRKGITDGDLVPVIDQVFPLADFAEAHRRLESNGQVGKIVVSLSPDGPTAG